jgi:hypothetical protein
VPKPFDYQVSAKSVLDNIPDSVTHNERTKQSATVVERLKHLKAGQNAWHPDLPKHLQLNVKGARLVIFIKDYFQINQLTQLQVVVGVVLICIIGKNQEH